MEDEAKIENMTITNDEGSYWIKLIDEYKSRIHDLRKTLVKKEKNFLAKIDKFESEIRLEKNLRKQAEETRDKYFEDIRSKEYQIEQLEKILNLRRTEIVIHHKDKMDTIDYQVDEKGRKHIIVAIPKSNNSTKRVKEKEKEEDRIKRTKMMIEESINRYYEHGNGQFYVSYLRKVIERYFKKLGNLLVDNFFIKLYNLLALPYLLKPFILAV